MREPNDPGTTDIGPKGLQNFPVIQSAVKTANGPLPAKLVNISTRLGVGTGNNALFGGFIITGNTPKQLIARALGPSLPLAGTLGNPKLEIYNSSNQLIAMNDKWKMAPNKRAIIDNPNRSR